MTNAAPQPEPTDALVALALCYGASGASAAEAVGAAFDCLDDDRRAMLAERAAEIDALGEAGRDAWRDRLAVRLARPRADELDANVNPSQVVAALAAEAAYVQTIVIRELPEELGRRIALYLDIPVAALSAGGGPNDEIRAAVRAAFLRNFVALADVYEPDELDRLGVDQLEGFVRHLGLREIATACRGIATKETLAAFLGRFDPDDAREIALYLTELDKIRPFWVAQADALVRRTWSADAPPASVVRKIGMKVLAGAFVLRDDVKCAYAAQKMPAREVRNWQRLVRANRRRYQNAAEDEKRPLDKRRRVVEKLAAKFAATGRL